jgi:hypothetical protein
LALSFSGSVTVVPAARTRRLVIGDGWDMWPGPSTPLRRARMTRTPSAAEPQQRQRVRRRPVLAQCGSNATLSLNGRAAGWSSRPATPEGRGRRWFEDRALTDSVCQRRQQQYWKVTTVDGPNATSVATGVRLDHWKGETNSV